VFILREAIFSTRNPVHSQSDSICSPSEASTNEEEQHSECYNPGSKQYQCYCRERDASKEQDHLNTCGYCGQPEQRDNDDTRPYGERREVEFNLSIFKSESRSTGPLTFRLVVSGIIEGSESNEYDRKNQPSDLENPQCYLYFRR